MQRASTLLGGAQREPRLHLGLPGGPRGLDQPLLLRGVRLLVARLLRRRQPLLELDDPGGGVGASGLGLGDGVGQTLRLGARRTGERAVLAQLLGDRGQGRVGLVQLGQRDVGAPPGLLALALEPDQVEPEPLARSHRFGKGGGGLVDSGLDLDQALLAVGAAGREVGAEEVAVPGHRDDIGVVGHQGPGGREVVDDDGLVEQAGERGPHLGGAVHDVDGVRRVAGQVRPAAAVSRSAAEQHAGAAEVVGLEVTDRIDGGVGVGNGDRIGGRAERAGHGSLVAGPDVHQRGDGAEQAGDRVGGGEQGTGAVLAGETQLERLLAGAECRPVAIGLLGFLPSLGEPLVDVLQSSDGGFVLGVEALLAGVEAGDLGLEGGEVVVGALGAGEGFAPGRLEPALLLLRRGRPGAQRVDLTVQAGEALTAVGGRAEQTGDPALLVGGGVLGGLAGGDGVLERGLVLGDPGEDLGLLRGQPVGLGVELGRIPTVLVLGLLDAGGVADPFGGEALGAAQSFPERSQGREGLLSGGQGGQVLTERGLECSLALTAGGLRLLDLLTPGDQHALVSELLLQGAPRRDQVVGEDPGLGIADVGLHGRRTPRDLGLPPERLELATNLAQQVVEPGQVAVGGVELAERLLLALAVLEDARRLLDEPAPVVGGRMQDRVELALARR